MADSMKIKLQRASLRCSVAVLDGLMKDGAWSTQRIILSHMKKLVKRKVKK